jgi:hypothetical protein
MLRRAKTSVLLALVGTLTASGAPLNPEQRNTTFQPGGAGRLQPAAGLKPAQAILPTGKWSGAKADRLTSVATAPVRVEKTDQPAARPGDTPATGLVIRQAGGAR